MLISLAGHAGGGYQSLDRDKCDVGLASGEQPAAASSRKLRVAWDFLVYLALHLINRDALWMRSAA